MASYLLTSELIDKIEALARKGTSIKTIGYLLRIAQSTLQNWLGLTDPRHREEAARDPMCLELQERFRAAQGAYESELLGQITAAGIEDWKAAAWILERKFTGSYCLSQNYCNFKREVADLDAPDKMKEAMLAVMSERISLEKGLKFSEMVEREAKIKEITQIQLEMRELKKMVAALAAKQNAS
jgi:hypothetical protein